MKSLIGKVVGGCKILGEIAQGGMGVVYRANQLSLDREVALKVLADRLAGDANFAERFLREARAIARINHPNILAIYDAGIDSDLDVNFMMMELIDGRSLSEVLQEKGIIPPRIAADYVRQAALGLGCAHQNDVVHRDVKPDNVMVTRQDVVKVSDFGLAKHVDAGNLTATDSILGTPAYMSPEQCDGKKLDGRTDIYSLGGTFYRIVTGRLPFEAETGMSMMYRHKHEPVTPPCQTSPGIPRALSDVIVRMMAKKREERYQSMEQVAQAVTAAMAAERDGDTQHTVVFGGAPGEAPASAPGAPPPAAPSTDPGILSVHPRRREIDRLIARGDARLKRGDLAGAVRRWQEAKAIDDDPRIKERIRQHVLPEAQRSREAAEAKLSEGQLSEAARLFRSVIELNPDDKDVSGRLGDLEDRIGKRREAVNQVRQRIASGRHEEAVEVWEGLAEDLRDPVVEKEIRRVRDVILPVKKLCDQADGAMEEGELEHALNLYRRAADVDPQNDRANSGLRDAERRLGRIERMLKDGYQHNVKESYDRAIEAWNAVLRLVPGHAQAKKLIIEARVRLAHNHRQKEGGRAAAIAQWKKILELDPEHRTARALLEEDQATQDGLARLSTEAQTAFSVKKYGRAIARWRGMLDIDPSNRKIQAMIEQAQVLRRKRRIVRLVVFVVLLAVAGAVGQGAREWLAIRKAEKLAGSDPSEGPKAAWTALETFRGPFILLGKLLRVEARKRGYVYQALVMEANAKKAEGDFAEVEALLKKARKYAGPQDQHSLDKQIAQNNVRWLIHRAEKAGAAGSPAQAFELYRTASHEARAREFARDERTATDGMDFWRLVRDAVGAERAERTDQAKRLWRDAASLRPDDETVRKALERLHLKLDSP